MRIPLSGPSITQREIDLVTEVLRSGTLSLGSRLPEFEERFGSFVGTSEAVAVSSGTSALHLCVRALGIGKNDEVITSSFSFVASANCVLYEGALPVFVDIDPLTLNLDPAAIRHFLENRCISLQGSEFPVDRVTGRTVKAILPVHVFGLPCDMHAIREIANTYNLSIIEDACEALGATYLGRPVGTFGEAGVFAFYPNKQMTTGEGGMIVTNNPHLADACRSMRNQGRDHTCSWLQHAMLGYNYRLSEIHCALGIGQLERLTDLLTIRRDIASLYDEGLRGLNCITVPYRSPGSVRSWFVYVVQLSGGSRVQRDQVIKELREVGIGCQAYFPAIHEQPYFEPYIAAADCRHLPNTERAAASCIALPFFPSITPDQINIVCHHVASAIERSTNTSETLMSA
jgi:perosamine synthetase